MQDGAPAHTVKAMKDFIATHFPTAWNDWSGNSPNLNPIEQHWVRLQDSVLYQKQPHSRDNLMRRVMKEWHSVAQDEVFTYVESLPRIIEEPLHNKE